MVDRPLAEKMTRREAGVPGADDDGRGALDVEVPQRAVAQSLTRR
jgi:hypothetical protein